jgi:hypothetical protein
MDDEDHLKIIDNWLLDHNITLVGGEPIPMPPRFWRGRSKAFQRFKRDEMRMCERQEKKALQLVKTRLNKRLAHAVTGPANFQTATLIASIIIGERDAFRSIGTPEAFEEYLGLEERIALAH